MEFHVHPAFPTRKDWRIGILGSGFIVRECHLVAYRKAGFNPVAIASRSRENAARTAAQHGIARVHESYERLLDDPSIEVLDIAVAPNAQAALIRAACERRTVRGILAQKPLGMNLAEAAESVRLCAAAGITLAVNQNMRHDPSVRAAHALLTRGQLGTPVFATIDLRAIPHWMPWQKELAWLTLRILSVHHLDAFRFWFGDPEGIYCSVRTDPRTSFPHTDGICTYILEYAGGLRCVGIDDPWTGPAREGCPADPRIQWRIEGLEGLATGDIGWCKDPFTAPSTLRYARIGDSAFHEPTLPGAWFPDAFAGTMSELLVALETGVPPSISGQDNLKTLALVDAAYLSAAEFRSVSIAEMEYRAGLTQTPLTSGGTGFVRRPTSPIPASPDWTSDPDSHLQLSPQAQEILADARIEAKHLNHALVGTEHLLLSLVQAASGPLADLLRQHGIAPATARAGVERHVNPGPSTSFFSEVSYTPRIRVVIRRAAEEAIRRSHSAIFPEDLLVALLLEDSVAARVLAELGLPLDRARETLQRSAVPGLGAGPATPA